jgi:hypothetical protein
MKIFIAILAFSFQAFATDPVDASTESAIAHPNAEQKEAVEKIKETGTIVKPTTEQTAAVSEAAVRAKKSKKKKNK